LKAKDKLQWIDEERYKSNLYTALKLSQDNEAPIANKTEFIKEFNAFNKMLDIDIQIPTIETRSTTSNFSLSGTDYRNRRSIKIILLPLQ
jgi:hypothetical protein